MSKSFIATSLCERAVTLTLLFAGGTGCFDFDALTNGGDRTVTVDAGADLVPHLPETCSNLVDGQQILFISADPTRPWTARCAGGLTYLPLVHTGSDANYSQYKAGGYSPGQDVVTAYTAVRLDPASLLVDVSDQTFSTSSGSLRGAGASVVTMPYGVAMDCVSKQTATGKANIDLRGTSFTIRNNVFVAGGLQTASTVALASDAKVANLSGGGECGWMAAGSYSGGPVNKAGGFQLPLQYQP